MSYGRGSLLFLIRAFHKTLKHSLLSYFALSSLLIVTHSDKAFAQISPVTNTDAIPPIVFVSRKLDPQEHATARTSPVDHAPQGKLLIYTPQRKIIELVNASKPGSSPDLPTDVADPNVSYDGKRILFSGYDQEDRSWRIYEIHADGTGFRQITRSDREMDLSPLGSIANLREARFYRYDDADPCYLPDGRICFVSTRYPFTAPSGRQRGTNLYVVNPDGTDLHRITTERFGADSPTVHPETGEVIYSRWWLSEAGTVEPTKETPPTLLPTPPPPPPNRYYPGLPIPASPNIPREARDSNPFFGINSWSLASIRPDGDGLKMFAGRGLDRELTMAYRPSFTPEGKVLALFLVESPWLGRPGQHGLRLYSEGEAKPQALGGPQTFSGSANMARSSMTEPEEAPVEVEFFYQSAEPISDKTFLVTGVPAEEAEGIKTDPEKYGIFIQNSPSEKPRLYLRLNGTAEVDAVPLIARVKPPVIADSAPRLTETLAPQTPEEAIRMNGSFTFLVENIFTNGEVDSPMATAPPFGEPMIIEFYMNPQRDTRPGVHDPILISKQEVPKSGRVMTTLPAGVPLFEVLRLPNGQVVRGRDNQVFHVGGMNFGVAGNTSRCVGCHAGHSRMDVPEEVARTNLAPAARITASSQLNALGEDNLLPEKLIDRSREPRISDWAAEASDDDPELTLKWKNTFKAEEIVLYGATPFSEGEIQQDLSVEKTYIIAHRGPLKIWSTVLTEPISPTGTRVSVTTDQPIDEVQFKFQTKNVSGKYMNQKVVALSEIEVIGLTDHDPQETHGILRGDADCSQSITIGDPLQILSQLYLGAQTCCQEACDVNLDSNVDASDSIHLLTWMFLGGEPPQGSWPACEPKLEGTPEELSCKQPTCKELSL